MLVNPEYRERMVEEVQVIRINVASNVNAVTYPIGSKQIWKN